MSSTIIYNALVIIITMVLLLINFGLAPHNPYMEKNGAFECGYTSFSGQNRTQFSISFFIFALLFLLFDLEILLVYPYLVSSYFNEVFGLIIMVGFLLVLIIGFAFELGKKALTIESRQNRESSDIENSSITENSVGVIEGIHFSNTSILKSMILFNPFGTRNFSSTSRLNMNDNSNTNTNTDPGVGNSNNSNSNNNNYTLEEILGRPGTSQTKDEIIYALRRARVAFEEKENQNNASSSTANTGQNMDDYEDANDNSDNYSEDSNEQPPMYDQYNNKDGLLIAEIVFKSKIVQGRITGSTQDAQYNDNAFISEEDRQKMQENSGIARGVNKTYEALEELRNNLNRSANNQSNNNQNNAQDSQNNNMSTSSPSMPSNSSNNFIDTNNFADYSIFNICLEQIVSFIKCFFDHGVYTSNYCVCLKFVFLIYSHLKKYPIPLYCIILLVKENFFNACRYIVKIFNKFTAGAVKLFYLCKNSYKWEKTKSKSSIGNSFSRNSKYNNKNYGYIRTRKFSTSSRLRMSRNTNQNTNENQNVADNQNVAGNQNMLNNGNTATTANNPSILPAPSYYGTQTTSPTPAPTPTPEQDRSFVESSRQMDRETRSQEVSENRNLGTENWTVPGGTQSGSWYDPTSYPRVSPRATPRAIPPHHSEISDGPVHLSPAAGIERERIYQAEERAGMQHLDSRGNPYVRVSRTDNPNNVNSTENTNSPNNTQSVNNTQSANNTQGNNNSQTDNNTQNANNTQGPNSHNTNNTQSGINTNHQSRDISNNIDLHKNNDLSSGFKTEYPFCFENLEWLEILEKVLEQVTPSLEEISTYLGITLRLVWLFILYLKMR